MTVIGDAYTYLSIVRFACDPGFGLVGANISQCQANKSWSAMTPTCTKLHCPKLTSPEYSKTVGQPLPNLYGSTVTFACIPGFTISGKSKLYCRANQTWSESVPKCKPVTCMTLKPDVDAMINSQNNSFGGEVSFTCVMGYERSGGDSLRTCQADGTWNGTSLSCSGMTANPGSIRRVFLVLLACSALRVWLCVFFLPTSFRKLTL